MKKRSIIPKSKLTISDIIDSYIELHVNVNLKESSKLINISNTKKIKSSFGHLDFDQVKICHISKFISDRIKNGCKSNTILREMLVFRSALQQALDNELVDEYNDDESDHSRDYIIIKRLQQKLKLKYPKKTHRKVIPTRDEINKISNHIQEQVIKDFIFIASRIGYRKGELLKLVWDDIDIANREIYIDSSKTGEPRRTFLPSELYQYIKGMYNRASSINGRDMKNYPLFPITYRVLNLRWNKTQMDLGFIKDGKIKYHIHELRKISIRWLKEECGLDRDCIMDIFTGHKSSHLYEQVYNLKSIDAINHYKEQILSL